MPGSKITPSAFFVSAHLSIMARPPTNHFVVIPLRSVSHLRLLLNFSLNLLDVHPSLIITFLISSSSVPLIQRDLSLQSDRTLLDLAGRYTIISVEDGTDRLGNTLSEPQGFAAGFQEVVKSVLQGQDSTAGRFARRPCAFICDVCELVKWADDSYLGCLYHQLSGR